jgi:hypothetical protein
MHYAFKQIQESMEMLVIGISSLANNPGIPEIVRNEFQSIANNSMFRVKTICSVLETDYIMGLGPQSLAMRNAVKYLGAKVEGNLDNLGVKIPLPIPEDQLLYAMCRWSQMLLTRWPLEHFNEDGKLLKVLHRDGVIIDADLIPGTPDENNTVLIDSIHYRIYTPENWWTISGSISRQSAIYNSDFSMVNGSVHHNVENAFVSIPADVLGRGVLDTVAEAMLPDAIVDTRLSGGRYPGVDKELPTRLLEMRAGRVHPERLKDALDHGMHHFAAAYRGRGNGTRVDFESGFVHLCPGSSDWATWKEMEELKLKKTWLRDTTPLVVAGSYLGGRDVSTTRLPIAILNIIEAAVEKYIDGLFADDVWTTPLPKKETEE